MLGIEIDQKRIFGLDFLRAFAIFCVVRGHGIHLLSGTRLSFLTSIPFPHGVDIFFVLSGFLIGSSFLKYAERQSGQVDWKKTLTFYARSALRILPNYYAILLVYCLLVNQQIVPGNIHEFSLWYFITFTQNLFTPFYNFYWESWSLPTQWWFYILFPLLLALASSSRVSARKATPWICLFFIVFSIVFRMQIADKAVDFFWWDAWVRKTVASRCDNIYIGVLAAWVKLYAPDIWKRYSIPCLIAGLLLMVLSYILPRPIGSFYTNIVLMSVAPVAIALWFPFLSGITTHKTFLGDIVSHLSVLSYAMFLTNLMVVQIIDHNFAEFFSRMGAEGYLLYWVLVIIAAYLLYILVEKPFILLRKRLSV